jgi:hypothetical protein
MLDDNKTENPPNRKITIFTTFLVVFSLLIVGLWAYSTFQKNVGSLKNPEEASNCWSYSYLISNIRYFNNTLAFDLENKKYSEAAIGKITVDSNNMEKSFDFAQKLTPGNKKTVTIENIIINDQFYAYADDCLEQGKIYKI